MRVRKASEEAVMEAARIIRGGGLVIYPTETLYGLGCDPFNSSAVDRLTEVKGRENKPLPIAASSLEKAKNVAHFTPEEEKVARRLWPGPLMLILKTKVPFPRGVTIGADTIGIRIPNQQVAMRLAELSGGYLVSTSANKSGAKPPRLAEDAEAQIGSKVDLVLDDGPCIIGYSSTILELTDSGPRILREGPVSLQQIIGILQS